jgi:predicted alpha/beta hydrolase
MITRETIRTKDAQSIGITTHIPLRHNGKVVIVGPSAELTQEQYQAFASYLAKEDHTVITYDYRGVGRSGPKKLRGYKASLHQWSLQDTDAVLLHVKHRYPKYQIIYVGHSISGEIIGMAPASQYISRMVIVSSALSCKRLFPVKDRIRIGMLKTMSLISGVLFGYFPGKKLKVMRDLPKGVVYEWANWCRNPNGLFDQYPDSNFRKLRIPILVISFSNDWRTPEKAVGELLKHFTCANIQWYHLAPEENGLAKTANPCFFYRQYEPTLWKKMSEWLEKDDNAIQINEGKEITIRYESTFQANKPIGSEERDELNNG